MRPKQIQKSSNKNIGRCRKPLDRVGEKTKVNQNKMETSKEMKFNQSKPENQKPDLGLAISEFQQKKESEKSKEKKANRPNAISLTNDFKITGGASIKKWLDPSEKTLEDIRQAVCESEKELFYHFEDNRISDKSIKDNYHTVGGGTEDGINWHLPTSRSEGLNFNS